MRTIAGIFTKKNTIVQNLLSYFFHSAFFFVLLTVLNILFYTMTIVQYENENEQLLLLNDFYTQLNEAHQNLYTYAFSGDLQVYRVLEEEQDCLTATLREISSLSVGSGFSRDLRDIGGILENYIDQSQAIHLLSAAPENTGSISSKYNAANDMFQRINSEFQNLYSQILNASRDAALIRQKKENCFLGCMVFALLLILVYETYQAKHLADRIARPIIALTESASTIERSGLEHASEIPVSPLFNEETRLLVNIFNSMLSKIQQQVADLEHYMNAKIKLKQQALENLKISEQLKNSQLKMLQMQINPHFLFNTLNMVSQTAYTENAYQTIFLLGKTASLLRYSLDFSDKSVTLKKELEELENYVYIQEQRFGNRIRFSFSLDERCHALLIPNLIVQPLVENAIVHGVSMYPKDASIQISTSLDPSSHTVQICVADNGVGMGEEQLKKVRQDMACSRAFDSKIGLSNVYHRLQYFFNGRADLTISSIPNVSTKFTIVLPFPDSDASYIN